MKKEKIIIKMRDIQLNQRKFTTSEISRGTGVERTEKGKGSYRRKGKYSKKYEDDCLREKFEKQTVDVNNHLIEM